MKKASLQNTTSALQKHSEEEGSTPSLFIVRALTMNSFPLVLLLSIVLTVSTASPASATLPDTLTLDNGKLSAHISEAPLAQVLEEFSRITGIAIRWLNGKNVTETVSVAFAHLPLSQGLQKILAKHDFMLFYSSPSANARLTQIWITNKRAGQSLIASSRVNPAQPASSTHDADREEDDPLTGIQPEQLTDIALQSNDPMLREKAVSHLGVYAHKDRRAVDALTRLAQQATHTEIQELATEALQQLE